MLVAALATLVIVPALLAIFGRRLARRQSEPVFRSRHREQGDVRRGRGVEFRVHVHLPGVGPWAVRGGRPHRAAAADPDRGGLRGGRLRRQTGDHRLAAFLELAQRLTDRRTARTGQVRDLDLTELACSIQGLSPVGAAAILAETGDLRRVDGVFSDFGDTAVRAYTKKFDGVSPKDFSLEKRLEAIPREQLDALRAAHERIRAFHERQLQKSWDFTDADGTRLAPGPGDRRLLKLIRGVTRRTFVVLGNGRIFYHLTYIDDLVEGFRLCGEGPSFRVENRIPGADANPSFVPIHQFVVRLAESARRRSGMTPPRAGGSAVVAQSTGGQP